MSDTPKTDAAILISGTYLVSVVPADFARAQERRIAELEASLDMVLPSWREAGGDIEVSALTMERRRVAELEDMLRRCEMWLSTHPEGNKMQVAVRSVFK